MMKKFVAKSACAGLIAALPLGANAACIDAFLTSLDAYQAGQHTSQPTFRVNQLVVLCFTPSQSGYVGVFDAPIEGDFQQLYPNPLTHPGGETYAEVTAGEEYCFGTNEPGNFPMYHPPEEGIGLGKISIALTARPDDQLDSSDFAIPGQVRRQTMALHLSDHRQAQAQCSARDVTYLDYRITQ